MDSTPSPLDPELLLAHAGFVRSVARSLLRDGSAVDDVVQQTWLTALERPPRDAGALRRWLARVVRSVARESRRSDERRTRREIASAPSEIDPRDPSALVERLARMRALTDAVLALPPPYRDAIVRRHLEELSPAEIARRDGVPVATIETRLKRARKQLRERLEQSYGIGRDALALLVIGVKTGATWKTATLAAAATLALAGAATWRVVAVMRAPETAAAAASEAIGMHERAASNSAAPRDAGGDSLVASVREIEPRLEWPDEATLRRLERHGHALFGGIVFAPDGTPCAGTEIRCDGGLVTTTDDRGAWRAEIAVDPPEGFNASSTFQSGWRGERKRLLLAHKEGLGVAVAEVAVPSRRIDLHLDPGHSFSGKVVGYEDGRTIGDVALEVRLDIRRDQLHPSALVLKGEADAHGAFTFANVPDSSLWLSGRADGFDSNGFFGFDFTHERDFAVTLRLFRRFSLRGRFVPWPCPGIAPDVASVVGAARSPHDGITGTSTATQAVAQDGRFELSLPACTSCIVSLVVGEVKPWEETVDTSEAEREWDVGVVELSEPPIVTGRVELPDDLDRSFVTCTLRADYSREIPATFARDGTFRAVLPSGTKWARLGVDFGGIAQASIYDTSKLTEAERDAGAVLLEPGSVRDVGCVDARITFLYGSIRDERGDPLPGAVVRVWATHESSILGRHLTIDHVGTANAESSYLGAIDLEHGPIVTMELEISAPGFAPQRFPQTIPEGARWVRRDLVLRDGVVLRGTLVDEHGAPCCGWTVAPCGFPIRTTFDRTRADGSFEIRGMADWECTVTAREPDGVEHAFPAIRPAGGSVALRLPPAPSAADGEEGR